MRYPIRSCAACLLALLATPLSWAQTCAVTADDGEFTGSWPIVVNGTGNGPLHVQLDLAQTENGYAGTWTMEQQRVVWTLQGKTTGDRLVLNSVGGPKLAPGVQIVGIDGISLEFRIDGQVLKGTQYYLSGGTRRDFSVGLQSGSNLCED
jgi:hypothetical protein